MYGPFEAHGGHHTFVWGPIGIQAIPHSLSYAVKNAQGRKGGVLHLFYFTAFILAIGQSVLGTFSESPNNNITVISLLRLLPRGLRPFVASNS